jgi:hypothetical protein
MKSKEREPEKTASRGLVLAEPGCMDASFFLDLLVIFPSSLHYLKIVVNI